MDSLNERRTLNLIVTAVFRETAIDDGNGRIEMQESIQCTVKGKRGLINFMELLINDAGFTTGIFIVGYAVTFSSINVDLQNISLPNALEVNAIVPAS